MAHYLHRHFADDAEVHVLHDLRLRDPEQPEQTGDAGRCQIDHLLIHRWGMFIIESKSVTSEVRVRPDGSGGVLNLGRHFDAAQSDWPALCRRIEEVLGGQLQLAPDCPPALESHAQHIAAQLLARHGELRVDGAPPQGQDVQPSTWTPWSSFVRARSVSSTWDCGRWTSSGCARACTNSALVHHCALPPSARSSRAWHARAPSAPPGAGSANAARSMSCWVSTSRPWSRCSSIAPAMR